MELMNWRKASYSGNGGNCVEVANGSTTVAVRDSQDQEGAPARARVELVSLHGAHPA